MNVKIMTYISACNTLHKAEEENSKRFFLFRRKYKKEIEKNRQLLKDGIQSILDDKWDTKYIHDLEDIIINNYNEVFHKFPMDDINIPGYSDDMKNNNSKKFYSINFYDRRKLNNERIIILDSMMDNIDFTIFDTKTGKTLIISSVYETNESQNKIVKICKNIILKALIRYIE